MKKNVFPFVGIEGQENLKLALILNLISPKISGVLIRGEKGTGKSTAVRGLGDLSTRHNRKIKVIELPLNCTEDRLVGSIDVEKILKNGEKEFQKGILSEANKNILYVDEINLLEDYIVDLLLDAAAMGENTVERDGISISHEADFILVGSMNPEEGELRPQLLDRFGLMVDVTGEDDMDMRMKIIKSRINYERNPEEFIKAYFHEEEELINTITKAKELIETVKISDEILEKVAKISLSLGVDGHRADITMVRALIAYAAYLGETEVKDEYLEKIYSLVYAHRLRKRHFEEIEEGRLPSIGDILNA